MIASVHGYHQKQIFNNNEHAAKQKNNPQNITSSSGDKSNDNNTDMHSKQQPLSNALKRMTKIKRYNKKLNSIKTGKSKELNQIIKRYKHKRDFLLNYHRNDLKNTLFLLRENAQKKESVILAENKQQKKLLNKRIINKLEKLKERNDIKSINDLKTEISEILIDSVENTHYLSSKRITRNRAKSSVSLKNIDLTKYKFGLTPSQIIKDLKYLMICENNINKHNSENESVSHGFNNYNYEYDNISIGFISHPIGFLNDRHLFENQLTGIYYKKARRKRVKTASNTSNNDNDNDNDYNMDETQSESPQKCRFQSKDGDTDYIINDDEISSENDDLTQNTVVIDGNIFKANDKIKIIDHNRAVYFAVIQQIMKYHIKAISDNKLMRIKYKDINNGYFNVFHL